MKVLIATPSFDRKVALEYHIAKMDSIPRMIVEGYQVASFYEARNLIHQCRSRAAIFAMKQGFDKLLFIDADISWKPDDIIHLLKSPYKIVGGVYPLKAFPVRLNLVPKQGIYETETYDPNEYIKNHALETGEVEVHMIPTGFLCIDVSVFKDLEPHVQKYHHRDQLSKNMEYESLFFPFDIAEDGFLYTEDWAFCDLARKHGHKIYWHTKVIVDHVGSHVYSATTPVDKSYKHINIQDESISQGKFKEPALVADRKRNPFGEWPRNLQCFCGSGKKFKRCHQQSLAQSPHCTDEELKTLQPDFERMLAHVQSEADRGVGYKLSEPAL